VTDETASQCTQKDRKLDATLKQILHQGTAAER
jgi:hypothetical protein